jgi:hypothetical protein
MSPILIGAGSFLIRKLGQLTAGMHRSKLSIDYISYMILAVSGGSEYAYSSFSPPLVSGSMTLVFLDLRSFHKPVF